MLKRIIHFYALFSGRGTYMWPEPAIVRAGRSILHKKSLSSALKLFVGLMFVIHTSYGWGQPWIYDFGTGTGSYNTASGVSTSFFTSTPVNGGTYRIRCATAGNQGSGFILANPGTSLGTGTELQINASITASTNKFTVYGWTSPTPVAYLKFGLRTTSASNGSLAIHLGDGGASTIFQDNNGYTSYNNSISTLLITYNAGAIASVQRRTSGAWNNIVGSGISKDANNSIEIYANNEATSTTYSRSGSNSLNAQSWDLWVDGTKISPSGGWSVAGTLASGTNLNGFGFFGESSTANAAFIYLDDFEYSNTLPPVSCAAPTTQASNITFSGITANSMTVNWTNGNGSNRIVIMNTSNSFTNPVDGTDPTADPIYGGSGEQVVFNGSGSSVAISGLNPSTTYYFRVYEYNCSATNTKYYTSTATNNPNSCTTISCLAPTTQASNITFTGVTSVSMNVNWTTGNGGKRIVIMNTSNSFTSPVDGTDPAANPVYGGSGEQVVYNNNGNTVNVSGLTLSTTYWFRVYEYNCTGGSTKYITSIATNNPNSQTTAASGGPVILEYGDLLVLGVNANGTACWGNNGDEISFVCFKNLTVGTSIDMTDNGWERCNTGFWGNTEGFVSATLTAGPISAGTVITFRNNGTTTWTSLSPAGSTWTFTGDGGQLNMNSGGDQLYFMQGGVWNRGVAGNHDATYTGGKILFGFNTSTTWAAFCGSGTPSTQNSNLYPGLQCFSLTPIAGSDYIKYTGPSTATTQRDWIDRIGGSSNWSRLTSCTLYNSTAPDYAGGYSISIIAGGINPGIWLGTLNSDWFLCDNWENMRVPDTATNVTINNAVGFQPDISNTALANCADITIGIGKTLTVNNNPNYFDIYGTLTNDGTFTHTGGTVRLVGGKHRSIAGSNAISFYNLTLNKNTNSLTITLNRNIQIKNTLAMTKGLILTGINTLEIGYNASNRGSLTMGTGIVVGNVKRWFTNAVNSGIGSGGFPIGVAAYARTAMIEFTGAPSAGGSLTAVFNTTLPGDYYSGLPIWDGGQRIDNLANEGYWLITFADGLTGGTYTCSLTGTGFLTATDPSKVRILKRPTAGGNWAFDGSHDATGVWPTVKRTGMSGFSQFAMGGLYADGNPLPVELLSFSAKYIGKVVNLNWSTASETNSDYFMVERSADAKLFKPLFSVKAAGNSNQVIKYSAIDAYPLKGFNYYRLKQTDNNSEFSYSKTVSVNISENNCDLDISSVYIQGNILKVQLGCLDSKVKIEITDVSGRIILTEVYNSLDDSQLISISLPDLKKGIYLIRATTEKAVVVKKFYL
jgi:hypothetical protein